jgi:hypothetical protein
VLLHDAGVAAGVGDGGGAGLQADEDARAADGIEHAGPAQRLGDSDRVGRVTLGVEGGDGVEDVAVGRLVEVVGRQLDLDRGDDGVAAEQHGAEQRLLGLDVVRGHPGAGCPLVAAPSIVDRLSHVPSRSRVRPEDR